VVVRASQLQPNRGDLIMELARQAEDYCAAKLNRTAAPSKYIVGFTTRMGRQLAIERSRKSIYCWTEPTSLSTAPCSPRELYPASRSRTSALNGRHAPRLMPGRAVLYWTFDCLEDFKRFVEWYA
jgi:hypothetical protein